MSFIRHRPKHFVCHSFSVATTPSFVRHRFSSVRELRQTRKKVNAMKRRNERTLDCITSTLKISIPFSLFFFFFNIILKKTSVVSHRQSRELIVYVCARERSQTIFWIRKISVDSVLCVFFLCSVRVSIGKWREKGKQKCRKPVLKNLSF